MLPGLALLALSSALAAQATPAATLRLEVPAALACPSEAAIRHALESRLGAAALGGGASGRILHLRATEGGVAIALVGAGERGFARTLPVRPGECAEAAETIALLVASWLRPGAEPAPPEHRPEPGRVPPRNRPPSPPSPPRPPAPPSAPTTIPAPLEPEGDLDGLLGGPDEDAQSVLPVAAERPDAYWGARLLVAAEGGIAKLLEGGPRTPSLAGRLELRFVRGFAAGARLETEGQIEGYVPPGAATARIGSLSLYLRIPVLEAARDSLGICAGFGADRVEVAIHGYDVPENQVEWLPSSFVQLGWQHVVSSRVFLSVSTIVAVRGGRLRFTAAPAGALLLVAPETVGLAAGVGFWL